jgi:hypothetical protein
MLEPHQRCQTCGRPLREETSVVIFARPEVSTTSGAAADCHLCVSGLDARKDWRENPIGIGQECWPVHNNVSHLAFEFVIQSCRNVDKVSSVDSLDWSVAADLEPTLTINDVISSVTRVVYNTIMMSPNSDPRDAQVWCVLGSRYDRFQSQWSWSLWDLLDVGEVNDHLPASLPNQDASFSGESVQDSWIV